MKQRFRESHDRKLGRVVEGHEWHALQPGVPVPAQTLMPRL
jgi:hypothetical protein